MNLQEFSALRVGDKVEIPMTNGNVGEVTAIEDNGIQVAWNGGRSWFYSASGTAWMHWTKAEAPASMFSSASHHSG
jgi:hypothetical protein